MRHPTDLSASCRQGGRRRGLGSRPAALLGVLAGCLVGPIVSCSRPASRPPPAAAAFRETKRLGDLVCDESNDRFAITNGRLRLEFDKATGEWVSLVVDGVAESLIARNKPGIALDFRVDQSWMVEQHGAKLREMRQTDEFVEGADRDVHAAHASISSEPAMRARPLAMESNCSPESIFSFGKRCSNSRRTAGT